MPFSFTADHHVELDALQALDALLGPAAELASDHSIARFEVVRLPDFVSPDGQVVASDGMILQSSPFLARLAPGSHPLRLVIARLPSGDARIAFALIGAIEQTVQRFELALVPGQILEALKPGNYYGYPVDSGIGSFASPAMHDALGGDDDIGDYVMPVMRTVYRNTRDWCSVTTADGSAALFSTGYGDGLYPSYFGVGAAGDPVILISDFNVVAWGRCPIVPVAPDAHGRTTRGVTG